jgi:alanyl-tRNA synthetase
MSKESKGRRNILILNRSAFYPTSGGQQNDTGVIYIDTVKYEVVNCEKVGNCTLHFLDKDIPEDIDISLAKVKGIVNEKRRKQLMSHHTGTHIIFAAARRVLGPHIWQNGAKKTTEKAHIDITHYQSLTYKEEMEIENEANRIIMDSIGIDKYFMNKKEAELSFGFSLYQGGVVPGNSLRIVQIKDTDVEACCGTHCDNTAEVGWLKLLRTFRVSDGVLRLEYVCYERALEELNQETEIINELCKDWGIEKSSIVKTGNRFFDDFKKYSNKVQRQEEHILNYQFKLLASRQEKLFYHVSDQETVGYFMSKINETHAKMLKEQGKGIVFLNKEYIFGMIGDEKVFSEEEFMKVVKECKNDKKKEGKEGKDGKGDKVKISRSIGKKKDVVEGIFNFSAICELNVMKIIGFIKDKGGYEV